MFDKVTLKESVVSTQSLCRQAKLTPPELRAAIDQAYQAISVFHKSQPAPASSKVETAPGVVCWQELRPIERVGLYVPGGSAPLVSTVLMLGIPARLAGCQEIILTTPPNSSGLVEPAICYAAQKVGITQVIMAGGIQAIAALTHGTGSIPRVDKIFGPGNQYVAAAKQHAASLGTAVDMVAGPSEVMVIADDSAKPAVVAADLLSQAEHGLDSQVVLVTPSDQLAERVSEEIDRQLQTLPRRRIAEAAVMSSFCIVTSDLDEALAFANYYAPEHLIIMTAQPESLARRVQNAGSVFIGGWSPESAGDYASGTNHTLPTGGCARNSSGLRVADFTKQISFQQLTKSGLESLASTIEVLADAEGLEAHWRAVAVRLSCID